MSFRKPRLLSKEFAHERRSPRSSCKREVPVTSEASTPGARTGRLAVRCLARRVDFLRARAAPSTEVGQADCVDHPRSKTSKSATGTPVAGEEQTAESTALAGNGGATVPLSPGYCFMSWKTAGTVVVLHSPSLLKGTHLIAVKQDTGLPTLPPRIRAIGGFGQRETAAVIPGQVDSIVSSSIYAYTRENARRNLDRIPLPQCPVLRPAHAEIHPSGLG
jgi:hypothetical protein